MILCSACLLGIKCRYDGKDNLNNNLIELSNREILIPICPEQLGGLPTPRIPAEKQSNGTVVTIEGNDVTAFFIKGAEETLKIAKILSVKKAVFKQRSPSCGCGQIYDGSFSKKLIPGDGICTKLLKKNGIIVITEDEPDNI